MAHKAHGRTCFVIVFVPVVIINPKMHNFWPMADDAITLDGMKGVKFLFYIYGRPIHFYWSDKGIVIDSNNIIFIT